MEHFLILFRKFEGISWRLLNAMSSLVISFLSSLIWTIHSHHYCLIFSSNLYLTGLFCHYVKQVFNKIECCTMHFKNSGNLFHIAGDSFIFWAKNFMILILFFLSNINFEVSKKFSMILLISPTVKKYLFKALWEFAIPFIPAIILHFLFFCSNLWSLPIEGNGTFGLLPLKQSSSINFQVASSFCWIRNICNTYTGVMRA